VHVSVLAQEDRPQPSAPIIVAPSAITAAILVFFMVFSLLLGARAHLRRLASPLCGARCAHVPCAARSL
jgi:hypothetical protein